ncbi:pseudouridine-5'-phosphate glycosidase-like isoform X2 [Armigeres subalbatus]
MLRFSSKLPTLSTGSCLSRRRISDLAKLSALVDIKPEVREALRKAPQSVVALESTIITHGMPYPQNLETALEVEQIVRKKGAVPATIAIVGGRVKVGVSADELKLLARVDKGSTLKTSRRDLAYVVSRKLNGGTTVAGTLAVASMVGIRIFATGGIGGVHRGGENSLDVSADLIELGRSPVAVVSSGVKSILDIPRTLEYLETQGVGVASFKCPDREFPAFYFPTSGCKANFNFNTAAEVAELLSANHSLGLQSGFLIGVPLPEEHAFDRKLIENATEQALSDAGSNSIEGKDMTPFVLAAISLHTKGRSLESNMALVKNNASVAAEIAVELCRLENGGNAVKSSSQQAPVVIGGSIVDTCITVQDDELKVSTNIHL